MISIQPILDHYLNLLNSLMISSTIEFAIADTFSLSSAFLALTEYSLSPVHVNSSNLI